MDNQQFQIEQLRQRLQSYAKLQIAADQNQFDLKSTKTLWMNFGSMFIRVPGGLASAFIDEDRKSIEQELQQFQQEIQ